MVSGEQWEPRLVVNLFANRNCFFRFLADRIVARSYQPFCVSQVCQNNWKVRRIVEVRIFRTRGLLLITACVLGLASGCSRGRQYPPTHSVSGFVTVEGQPVAEALVSFLPVDGQNPANGVTDASGRYELTSFTRGDGAMEGSFRVTIVKYEKEVEDEPAASAEKPAAEEADSGETGNEGYVPAGMLVSQYDTGPKNLLPKQYADQQKTPLTAAVRAEENSIDFDLSK